MACSATGWYISEETFASMFSVKFTVLCDVTNISQSTSVSIFTVDCGFLSCYHFQRIFLPHLSGSVYVQRRLTTLYKNLQLHRRSRAQFHMLPSTTYSERVSKALGIQHAMRMRHVVICGLPGFAIFFHIFT